MRTGGWDTGTHLRWREDNNDLVNQIVFEYDYEGEACFYIKLAGAEEYCDESFTTLIMAEAYCKDNNIFIHEIMS